MSDALLQMLHAIAGGLRSQVALGIVESVNDAGGAQTVNLKTGDGVERADVEVMMPFGFASMPPLEGAICLVFSIGADPSNAMALPIGNPTQRMGKLLAGEAALYGADASRLHFRQGGVAELWAAEAINEYAKSKMTEVPNGYTIKGDVIVQGNLTTTGDVADSHGTLDRLRGNYNRHTNPGGGGTTAPDPE